jgi:hypothetical protein
MPNITRTEQERRARAIADAEYGNPERTEDWLRMWLPNLNSEQLSYNSNALVVHALAGLRGAATLRDAAEQITGEYVERAREHGASWTEVGQALRMTRQGAQRRYGSP